MAVASGERPTARSTCRRTRRAVRPPPPTPWNIFPGDESIDWAEEIKQSRTGGRGCMNANPMAHRSVEIPKRSSGWHAGRLSAARLSMTMDLQALGLFRWRGRNAEEGEDEEEEEITWDFNPLELVPQRRPMDEISDVTSASTEDAQPIVGPLEIPPWDCDETPGLRISPRARNQVHERVGDRLDSNKDREDTWSCDLSSSCDTFSVSASEPEPRPSEPRCSVVRGEEVRPRLDLVAILNRSRPCQWHGDHQSRTVPLTTDDLQARKIAARQDVAEEWSIALGRGGGPGERNRCATVNGKCRAPGKQENPVAKLFSLRYLL
uniref:Uncharacterized protein n=1 Tax=Noctiluca scintillans TaxID=2966 RepID=A0A7S1B1I7_NOCSC